MRIKEIAHCCNVKIDTIRYYEKRGLIPEPKRSVSLGVHPGYREYDQADVERILFVRRSQALGFSLNEIQQLLELRHDPDGRCEPVVRLAHEKLRDIENKIRTLGDMQNLLEEFISECDGSESTDECTFFDKLIDKELK